MNAISLAALLLGALILGVELLRPRVPGRIDFQRAINALYVMCFVAVPLHLHAVDPVRYTGGPWAWVPLVLPDDRFLLMAELIAMAAWLLFAALVNWPGLPIGRRRAQRPPLVRAGARRLRNVAVLLTVLGAAAFIIYTAGAGGLASALQNAMVLRMPVGADPTASSFLKNVAPLLQMGSVLLFALMLDGRWRQRRALTAVFVVSVIGSLLVLFQHAGRLSVLLYVGLFVMVPILRGRTRGLGLAVGYGTAFLAVTLLGKQVFNAFVYPEGLGAQLEIATATVGSSLGLVVMEFSVPYVLLGCALDLVPSVVPPRWFLDGGIALGTMLPDAWITLDLPPTLSATLVDHLGVAGLPVDLLSFGLFSGGFVGILIVVAGFGLAVRWCERAFPPTDTPVGAVLRALGIQFVAFRLLYADPAHWMIAGFPLFVAIALLKAPGFRLAAPD